jgi:hypothetical protein
MEGKSWQELAAEHMERRAQWDHDDWLRQKKSEENTAAVFTVVVLVSLGFVLGALLT